MNVSAPRREHPSGFSAAMIDQEILRTTLIALTDELATVLANAAPIAEINQVKAFSVAIADPTGNIVAIDNPLELGSLAQTVAAIVDFFEFDLKDGDVVLTNDPYHGGTRVQEFTLLAPLFVDSMMVLNLVARVPVRDMGGQVGGNLFPTAMGLLSEGVPVTPIKIQRLGRPARDLLGTLLLNGRRPEETRRVLDAATATLALGQRRLTGLIEARGADAVRAGLEHAQQYSETLARAAITSWQDGIFRACRTLSDDPSEAGPVGVEVQATIEGDELTLDFTASADQRLSFINSSSGTTASCALRVVQAVLGETVPANSGLMRAVRLVLRPGSVTDPVASAPVGWGHAHCGNEITDVVAEALRSAVPHPLPVLTGPRPLTLARHAADRSNQIDLGRWAIGGASATPNLEGWGPPALSTRSVLPSVEQWELEQAATGGDVLVHQLEFAPDTAGAGTRPGAPGIETVIDLPPGLLYTLWTPTVTGAVEGLDGGVSGRAGEVAVLTAQGWQPAPTTAIEQVVDGRRIRLRLPGGGGYGPPAARDHAAVLADLEDGLISAAVARDVYGLEIDPDPAPQQGSVDHG